MTVSMQARVPPEVHEMAHERADELGISAAQYLERLIRLDNAGQMPELRRQEPLIA